MNASICAPRLVKNIAVAMLAMFMLSSCEKSAPATPPPTPAEVSDIASGHYCGMQLTDHDGPKGQVFVIGVPDPIWFSSVRDTIAFLRLPEETKDIAAVFVNDMAKARNWEQPEAGAWVDANKAWFVIGSKKRGGMGAQEAIPFGAKPAAEAFLAEYGGKLARLGDIPDAYVIGPVDLTPPMPSDAAAVGDRPGKDDRAVAPRPATDIPAQAQHSGH